MADSKITALTALTAADPVNDMFPVVDVSDTSMAASGTTKRISANNILSSSPTASGALTVTGLVTAGSATITGAATVGTTLGVTGVSTLASAVVTGALTSGTTTLVAHAAGYTGKVGIGTATPSSLLALNQASGAYSLNMDGGGYGTIASFGIVNVGVDNNSYIGSVGNNDFLIKVANSTRATFDQNGHFNLANGNVVMTTSGKGIDFAATSSVGTSELLNDYEEGTWTGTLTGSTTNPTIAVTTSGRYTKVGRVVTVDISFLNISTAGALGNISITGLPFTSNGSVQAAGGVYMSLIGTFTGSPAVLLDGSSSTLTFISNISSASNGNVTHNAGTGRYLTASITYTV